MLHRRGWIAVTLMSVALFVVDGAWAADWGRFRGANGAGTSPTKGLPTTFGPEQNVDWVVDVPFGRSSPVVTEAVIYLTATEDGKFVTLAIDRKTGTVAWKNSLAPAREAEFHADTDSATTTPVTDGDNVYVFFQEFGIVSYDSDGNQRWAHAMGPFDNFYSIAASPILSGNQLYMLCDQKKGSFLLALDTRTGKEAWRTARPGRRESYTTPILYPNERKPTALIIFGDGWVDAYDLKSGDSLWAIPEVGGGPVSSPVLVGNTVYLASPDHGENGWPPFDPILEEFDQDKDEMLTRDEVAKAWLIGHYGWLDRDSDDRISRKDWDQLANEFATDNWGAYAIQLKKGGKKSKVLWNYRKNVSEIATPLVHDGIFYMVEKSILTTLDAKTGELIKRDRILDDGAKTYASPIAADGKVYLGTLEGSMIVISGKGEWETLARADLGEEIWATPAVADDQLYVRTRGKLYAFGDGDR